MNLVTGATGFLGSHVVDQLVARGRRVRVLVRPSSEYARLQQSGVEIVTGSLEDEKSLIRAAQGVKCIYHCAAKVSDFGPWAAFRESNVTGLCRLIAAATEAGVTRFVHVSTTEVYGHPNKPVAEDAPFQKRGWPYCDTKIDAEAALWRAYHETGFPVTVIRPASIYGPRSTSFCLEVVALLQERRMLHIDRGNATAGLGYVTNVVDLMLLAADSSKALGQAYNASDGTSHTWRDYVEALADTAGLQRPRLSVPRRLAYAAGWTMEQVYSSLGVSRRPILTRMAVEVFGSNQGCSIEKARKELGFTPRIGFSEGMELVGKWLRETGTAGC